MPITCGHGKQQHRCYGGSEPLPSTGGSGGEAYQPSTEGSGGEAGHPSTEGSGGEKAEAQK